MNKKSFTKIILDYPKVKYLKVVNFDSDNYFEIKYNFWMIYVKSETNTLYTIKNINNILKEISKKEQKGKAKYALVYSISPDISYLFDIAESLDKMDKFNSECRLQVLSIKEAVKLSNKTHEHTPINFVWLLDNCVSAMSSKLGEIKTMKAFIKVITGDDTGEVITLHEYTERISLIAKKRK